MRLLLIFALVMCVSVMVGCGGKKARPPEDLEGMGEQGAKTPGEGDEAGADNEPVTPIEPGGADKIKLNRIHFDYDKYNLDDDAITTLAENAAVLMDNPSVKIRIEGHCDSRGTEDYNLALGEKRALAARDYLVNFGIAQSRISVISYGEERPLDPAETEKAWAKNRRAEFDIR
ncbi:MAG: peptidoglycan-associated lipoprotein Pal [bacterium]